ncbi:helix-turn-helix transcriptional regulator [Taklimakanibacter lacteus]|uniref:helix-turn-helix transcriptional regulator n=1 Tax=Taklimakanibacter lacteus TaxID=2268456 RepID=UPI0013C5313A
MSDVRCELGPQDRSFEERHDNVAIAVVLAGAFLYRSESGCSLMYPGSVLLGNAGACFECGHDHGTGDHCISFHFSRPLFEEIAASAAGSHRFRFPTTMLPAIRQLAAHVVNVEAAARRENPIYLEELSITLAESVLGLLSDDTRTCAHVSARDRRRTGDVVRHIEDNADQPLSLAGLASAAGMSKYHFLRSFRRVLGVTPYQLILNIRMRRAALALRTTSTRISAIAYEAGFGDLSTFNARFREMAGMTPQAFRKAFSQSMIRKSSWPSLTRPSYRFSGKIMRKQKAGA